MIKRALLAASAVTALVITSAGSPTTVEAKPKSQTLCDYIGFCIHVSKNQCGMTDWQVVDAINYWQDRCA